MLTNGNHTCIVRKLRLQIVWARGGQLALKRWSTPVNYTYVYIVRHFFHVKTGTAMAISAATMVPGMALAIPAAPMELALHLRMRVRGQDLSKKNKSYDSH